MNGFRTTNQKCDHAHNGHSSTAIHSTNQFHFYLVFAIKSSDQRTNNEKEMFSPRNEKKTQRTLRQNDRCLTGSWTLVSDSDFLSFQFFAVADNSLNIRNVPDSNVERIQVEIEKFERSPDCVLLLEMNRNPETKNSNKLCASLFEAKRWLCVNA